MEAREVTGDEGRAHELAVGGDGDDVLEAVGEPGEDLANVGNPDFAVDGRGAIALEGLPESITCQKAERQIGVVLVVVFADEQEASGETIAELLAPRNVFGSGESFIDQIEGGEQQERFVGFLMGRAFLHRRGADAQVVKAFDGSIQEHG